MTGAKFDIRFVNQKFPWTSSNDFANFSPPLVIIDFINELRSRQTCGNFERLKLRMFVNSVPMSANANQKESGAAALPLILPSRLITIEKFLFFLSRIPALNPPLYKVIQEKKNGNELLAPPSTESICKERKNCKKGRRPSDHIITHEREREREVRLLREFYVCSIDYRYQLGALRIVCLW